VRDGLILGGVLLRFTNKHLTCLPLAATLTSSRYIRKLLGPFVFACAREASQKIEHLR